MIDRQTCFRALRILSPFLLVYCICSVTTMNIQTVELNFASIYQKLCLDFIFVRKNARCLKYKCSTRTFKRSFERSNVLFQFYLDNDVSHFLFI